MKSTIALVTTCTVVILVSLLANQVVSEEPNKTTSGEVIELKKEYRDVVRQFSELIEERYRSGQADFAEMIKARDKLLLAEIEIVKGTDKAKEKKFRSDRVANLRELEAATKQLFDVGAAQAEQRLLAKADRLAAEIELAGVK